MVVHDVAQARDALAAAADLGRRVQLRSAPDAAAYAGVGYLKALGDAVDWEIVVDCGDDPALVMAALRCGCRRIAFSGSPDAALRLGDMARQQGVDFDHESVTPTPLHVGPNDDAAEAVRARLGAPLCDDTGTARPAGSA